MHNSLFHGLKKHITGKLIAAFAIAATLFQGAFFPLVASADITVRVYNQNGFVSEEVRPSPTTGTLTYTYANEETATPNMNVLVELFLGMNTASGEALASAECDNGEASASVSTSVTVDALGNTTSALTSASADCEGEGDEANENDDHKVVICHIPPGNPENMQTIEIDRHALDAHVSHHGDGEIDTPGECPPLPPPVENEPPVITLLGANPMVITKGELFVDPGATAVDAEDGDITSDIVTTGLVNTLVLGTYTISYNVSDSDDAPAPTQTRTVSVVSSCADGKDNDGDDVLDYPLDTGCDDPNDNDENNRPVITLIGSSTIDLIVGMSFIDPGATATDPEDGVITPIVVGTVNTTATGTYILVYNATDSQGLAALPVTRVVNVNPEVTECNDGLDNDGDETADYGEDSGCDTPSDNDENSRPVITLLGSLLMELSIGTPYVEPGFSAVDLEDGTITHKVVASSTYNTGVLGMFIVTYNATDSANLAAAEQLRTIRVISECSDGVDNDNDNTVDLLDPGCGTPEDNDEEDGNNPPVITVIGDNPMSVTVGAVFIDPGATTTDPDGDAVVLSATGTVNTSVIGTYSITYSAIDEHGATATPKTRTVNVTAGTTTPPCTSNCNPGTQNTPPVIMLIGGSTITLTQGTPFTDPGATAVDAEDGVLTPIATGTVDVSTIGTYTIAYNATDTLGLAAVEVVRTVSVVGAGCTTNCPPPPCVVNCGGGGGGTDNIRPILTLIGSSTLTVVTGSSTFADPGATAFDQEDGDITARIVTTGTVNSQVIGTYTITYNVSDSQGLPALQLMRTIYVVAGNPSCTVNCGGGGNPVCTVNCGGGNGGGGTTPATLTIFNEKIEVVATTTVRITWNTNKPSDSRVVYGLNSRNTLGNAPSYGYSLTTATDTTKTTNHRVTINGIPSAVATYYRPVSSDGLRTVVGIELKRTFGEVLGAATSCSYIREYLRLGANNNPSEVTKLQLFLRNEEGFSTLAVTGFFDTTTDKAVREFQDRHKSDVLDPWDLPGNTGYVYYTTQKKINELHCKKLFPLNETQLAEIAAFRELVNSTNGVSDDGASLLPLVGMLHGGEVESEWIRPENVAASVKSKETNTLEEKRGSVAMANMLATMPNVDKVLSGTASLAQIKELGTSTRRGIASVINSLADRTDLSERTVLLVLFLTILSVILVAYFERRYEARAKDPMIEETPKEGDDTKTPKA